MGKFFFIVIISPIVSLCELSFGILLRASYVGSHILGKV
jgi:hypothetical protein